MSSSEPDSKKGLSSEQVLERIRNGQQNVTSKAKTKTIKEIFVENIFSVFNVIILLIILFLLFFYLRTSDTRLILDCIGISLIAVINTSLAVYQEIKAKRALDKVNLLLKRDVIVIRDGREIMIDPSEIVIDDVLKIQRGDQIVVDGIVLESNHLEIDESLLTGESNPIHKKINEEVLSGSFCLSGNGCYKAVKVGDKSYAAEITQTAKKYKFTVTPLQRKLNFIVKSLFGVAILLVILEVLLNDGTWSIDFVRKVSTILISLVPQGLVLMASVTFAVGVFRISKIGAIIQKLNAIESFSNVKIVCTDKTGTLTKNRLTVYSVIPLTGSVSESRVRELAGTYAALSSEKNATIQAMMSLNPDNEYKSIDELPFSSERKYSVIKIRNSNDEFILVLGAYDVLAERLSNPGKEEANKIFKEKNLDVYRNLLLGRINNKKSVEDIENNASPEIEPLAVISITDEVRDDVMDAINLFESNGIEIKILSGDSAKAIQAVSHEIGWNIEDDKMILGSDLEKLSGEEFRAAIKSKIIFARLKPEHKLRIIKELRRQKIYTAMLGDGVNDLPAIKEADMGIAMEEGSSITKEVADIVLLKNKFSLLPEIFNEGNKIVNSVRSVAKLFLTKNFLVIYISLLSLLFLLDFPLTPRRVSLINIFGIGLPAFIITLKNRNSAKCTYLLQDVFSFVIISSVLIVAAGYLGVYIAGSFFTLSDADVQMVMLSIMIITNIANYFSIVIHKDEENKRLYFSYGIILLALFILFASVDSNFFLIRWVKIFYEIDFIRFDLWKVIASVSIIASGILFVIQKSREQLLKKLYGKETAN